MGDLPKKWGICVTPDLFTDHEDYKDYMATPDYKTSPLISVELFSDEDDVITGIANMEISSSSIYGSRPRNCQPGFHR